MLGRIGKRQDQDKLPPEDRGHQEAAPKGIGNEALGHYLANDLNVFDHVSNEATDEEQGSQDAEKAVGTVLTLIDNIAENDPQAASEIEEKAEQNLDVPEDVSEEGLSDYYRNDLNRLDPKKDEAGNKHKDSGNIMNDDDITWAED